MATFVHRKNTPDGPRYRVWNTVVDTYETPPLTRAETLTYLDRRDVGYAGAEGRLARADANGTSSRRGDTRDMDGPWDTELCAGAGCGRFHHAYVPRGDGSCSWCGEPEGDRAHVAPCFDTLSPSITTTEEPDLATLVADLESAAAKLRELPPFPVRLLAPSEVLRALESMRGAGDLRAIEAHQWLPAELTDEDLPAWTVRAVYSDGTSKLVRVR